MTCPHLYVKGTYIYDTHSEIAESRCLHCGELNLYQETRADDLWGKWLPSIKKKAAEMTNTELAKQQLMIAMKKINDELDPSYDIMEALKHIDNAGRDVDYWKNKYLMKLSEVVR